MIEEEYLHHFITEEIFLLDDSKHEAEPHNDTPKPVEKELHKLVIQSQNLSQADKDLLGKILSAIQFDLAKVPVLETLSPNIDFEVLISFGKESSDPGMEHFKPLQKGLKTFLNAPALSSFHGNDTQKKLLWSALKQIFQNK